MDMDLAEWNKRLEGLRLERQVYFPAGGRLQARCEFRPRWLRRLLLVEPGRLELRQQRVEHVLQFGRPQSRRLPQPFRRVLRQAGIWPYSQGAYARSS